MPPQAGAAFGGAWLRMAFTDVRMPGDHPPQPRHGLVYPCHEKLVGHWGFRHTITFTIPAGQVNREVDGGQLVRSSGPDGERTRKYDAAMATHGHRGDPKRPAPSHPGIFNGEQIHARHYRSAAQPQGGTPSSLGQ